MAIEPAGHRILILPETVEEKTAGGIILAANTQQREQQATMRGTVVKVGVNAWKAFDEGTPWAVKGDRVVFRKYAGEVVKDGDTEYRVVNDEDIIAVVREG
jgi:chaperonin GroES